MAADLFEEIPIGEIAISTFSLDSILLILIRYNRFPIYKKFLTDLFVNGDLTILNLSPTDLLSVIEAKKNYNLDFDDSYQYLVCKKFDLPLVTFDKDFKTADIEVLTPKDILPPHAGEDTSIRE